MWRLVNASMLVLFAIILSGCSMGGPGEPGDPGWFLPPDKPDGPSVCRVGEKVEFETGGTDPLGVHEFYWDFGDGEMSGWDDDDESVKHRFHRKGRFTVRVKERCPLELFKSGWSKGHKITVK